MGALLTTVLMTSLLGSLHCAQMCGAFVLFAVGTDTDRPTRSAVLQASYNAGRLVTYLFLGVVAGAIGSVVEMGGSLVGLQNAAAIGAGAMMTFVGVVLLARVFGARLPRAGAPEWLKKLVTAAHRRAMVLPPVARALAIGLCTTLLPCGWLYAYVVIAAGTGSPAWGAASMGVFWLGTLPIMVAIGTGAKALLGPLNRALPAALPLAIVIVGVMTVVSHSGHIGLTPEIVGNRSGHGASGVEEVKSLTDQTPACCESEGTGDGG